MRVETLGSGNPEVAIIGGIHGDEPCGPAAIEALLAADPDVERGVKLIVVNEEAIEEDVRYLEEDLNRAFPGSPSAATHEGRLAHKLLAEIRDLRVLSLHSTQSHAAPFALLGELTGFARSICPYLSIEAVVDTGGYSDGRLLSYPSVVEVECGLQRSAEAAENAEQLAEEFLRATGALSGDGTPPRQHPLPVFELIEKISKSPEAADHEVFVENFERVAEGEHYAATDGDPHVARRPFYPVLLSSSGYQNVFGYAGELVGRLDGDDTTVTASDGGSATAEGSNR